MKKVTLSVVVALSATQLWAASPFVTRIVTSTLEKSQIPVEDPTEKHNNGLVDRNRDGNRIMHFEKDLPLAIYDYDHLPFDVDKVTYDIQVQGDARGKLVYDLVIIENPTVGAIPVSARTFGASFQLPENSTDYGIAGQPLKIKENYDLSQLLELCRRYAGEPSSGEQTVSF